MVTFNAYSLTERVVIKVQKWEKKKINGIGGL